MTASDGDGDNIARNDDLKILASDETIVILYTSADERTKFGSPVDSIHEDVCRR